MAAHASAFLRQPVHGNHLGTLIRERVRFESCEQQYVLSYCKRESKHGWGKRNEIRRTSGDHINHETTRSRRQRKLFCCLFGEVNEGVVSFFDFVSMRDP